MNCDQARELMDEELDGLLEISQSAALYAHFKTCPVCKREYDALRLLVKLGEASQAEVPFGFAADVMKKLKAENILPMPKKKYKVPFSVFVAAAAVFVLAFTFNGSNLELLSGLNEKSTADMAAAAAPESPLAPPAFSIIQNKENDLQTEESENAAGESQSIPGDSPSEQNSSPETGVTTDDAAVYDQEKGEFILSDETILHDDPLKTSQTGKFAFLLAIHVPADFDFSENVKGLTKIATVEDAYYYKVSQSQLQGVLKKLGDSVETQTLPGDLYIDEEAETGMIILYQK